MEKRLLISIIMLCLSWLPFTTAFADLTELELQTSIYKPTSQIGGIPKVPIMLPTVYIDCYTLYNDRCTDGYDVEVVYIEDDGGETTVFSATIAPGVSSWQLPTTLTGEYVIKLIYGNYCFWGIITL